MASLNMSLKLLVDKRAKKVLFAEATKEFVDFLFHIFSLPLGTLIEFLGSKQMVGCLGKLKESIEIIDYTYLQPGIIKDDIFNPKTVFKGNMLLLSNDASANDKLDAPKTLYRCSYTPLEQVNVFTFTGETSISCELMHVTEHLDAMCPNCGRDMNVPLTSVKPQNKRKAVAKEAEVKKKQSTGGYVKEVVTYMVMDDLVVSPMSTISSITLINSFGVKDLSQLEEKTLPFGKDEALKLLKASLMTDQVLTTLFQHV
ncbi:hypothetical protein L1887_19816 [Cichorium endivia]|nr:hypothetical protein L1887_19816 [Cichorium endivia]